MFERFTDPAVVVGTVLAGDMRKLRKLIAGGARVDRRTTYHPWATPLDAASSTRQLDALNALLDAGAPIFGSAIYEAIRADFVAGLRAFHRRDEKFHQKFQQDAGHQRNPRLNRWLSEFTALDFALSIHAVQCVDFLESIASWRHKQVKPHLTQCSAVFIEEESYLTTRGVNIDGLAEVTSGFYCAKCERFVGVPG